MEGGRDALTYTCWIIVRTVLYSKVNDGSVEYVHSFFFDGFITSY
jgi:hypothetical protein